MIFSNSRKLMLSGWLKENDSVSYGTPLKLQKYLLFYELFSKMDGEVADFSHLRGYKNGPVFSSVYGDYTKDRIEFDQKATETYNNNKNEMNSERAMLARFIVASLPEKELSLLTHELNLWDAKKDRIEAGEKQVTLDESDFNSHDVSFMRDLESLYPESLVKNSLIIPIDNCFFVFNKDDAAKVTEQHMDTLATLASSEDLVNPVYVDIDSEGRLVID